jgi:methanethiol S-methyltransferase
MVQPANWLSKLLLVLASSVGVGSVVAFAGWPLGALRLTSPAWSEPRVLAWDAALSMLFFVQHSGMIRKNIRARMAQSIPQIYLPAIYAVASGLALLLIVLLWQPSQVRILSLAGPARAVAHGLSVAAIGLFVWGMHTLRSFDPLGLGPVAGHLRAKPPKPCAFVVRGAYRFVRHPLYLAVIVLIWMCPDITADRMLFNLLWTAWIVVGTVLEEADLVTELGEPYRQYRRTVPMLIPWTKTTRVLHAEGQNS